MKVALLITTFNSVEKLDLVLTSVLSQKRAPDQVIVCDDGSLKETTACVTSWSKVLPIIHVWQPDIGFRAARVRNIGVSKADADYLIFVDGDCLLPPEFVSSHVGLAQQGRVVSGGRQLLNPSETKGLVTRTVEIERSFVSWKFKRYPLGILRDLTPRAWRIVRSCNLSLHKRDMERVDGFDESFVGWGLEDSDFVLRLLRAEILIRSARFAACVSHLFHQENTRDKLSRNAQHFDNVLSSRGSVKAVKSSLGDQ